MKGLRDSLQSDLRCAVRAEAGRGDLTADAGHLHDRAAALSPHAWEHGAGCPVTRESGSPQMFLNRGALHYRGRMHVPVSAGKQGS